MRHFFTFAFLFFGVSALFAQEKVVVLEIREEIAPSIRRYTKLALAHAESIGADYVLVDINTYGGTVKDADEIRTLLLNFERPLWAFINKNAASAGALISIACDKIYMQSGSHIGAATVVRGQEGEKAPDKYQSYMRAMMRATAETKGRNPKIAEAMVDENIAIEGVSAAGQVLTFTTEEALAHGFCEGKVNRLEDILAANQVTDYVLERYTRSTTEKIIHFFLNPAISSLLILIILGGIYFELQSPGVGFPLFAAVLAAVLYFLPYYLNGLAAHWEIALFIVGLLLIAAEIFFIPGFGAAGILGLICTLSSLFLVMIDNNFFDFSHVPPAHILSALTSTLGGALAGSVLILVAAGFLNHSNNFLFRRIALQNTLQTSEGFTSSFLTDRLIGTEGTAHTVLRPAGKVKIGDEIYDATTQGDFIDRGENIEVIDHEGTWLKVKKSF